MLNQTKTDVTFTTAAALLWVCLWAAGCAPRDETGAYRYSGDLAVRLLDESGLETLLQQRRGRPLLLNIWATWCVPCREEFPLLVDWTEALERSGVDIAAVSTDYPDERTALVVPFLKKQKAAFPVYVWAGSAQEHLIERLAPDWSGALPATFMFGPDGSRRAEHVGMLTDSSLVLLLRGGGTAGVE